MAVLTGSIGTGEHGVGIGKREYLYEELGFGTVELMKSIKRTIDPLGLFNPGKVSNNSVLVCEFYDLYPLVVISRQTCLKPVTSPYTFRKATCLSRSMNYMRSVIASAQICF